MLALRPALVSDIPELVRILEASARGLCRSEYTCEQVEAALGDAWGVDRQLIEDGTYFVVVSDGQTVACGGWSRRATAFGGDQGALRDPRLLDPAMDAARIRAFFVRPEWARRGIGRLLLQHCEREALAAGFGAAELVATLGGHPFYRRCGYRGDSRVRYVLRNGTGIDFVPMQKRLAAAADDSDRVEVRDRG